MRKAPAVFVISALLFIAAHLLDAHIGPCIDSGAVALLAVAGIAFLMVGALLAVLESAE